jgi:hypothetical protein
MRKILLMVLLANASFGTGFAFHAWLHRPIKIRLAQQVAPPTQVVKHGGPFDSPVEAALDALSYVYQHLPYYEAGGVVLEHEGKYYTSKPVTDFVGASVHLDEDPASYPGSRIVATYHNHPCLDKTFVPGEFSPQDLRTSRVSNTAGYMLDFCTGELHVWDPKIDDNNNVIGRIVGHVPVRSITMPEDGSITD